MVTVDPKALQAPVSGVGTAPFEGSENPKGLIHTTEGFTIDSAMGSYRANGFAPHETIGPDNPDRPTKAVRWQHLPFTGRSTTLADDSGGVRTNRLWVYQVEIVGTCDDSWKTRYGGRYAQWHVDNWPEWYREAIADLMTDWERWFGIPRRSTVTWKRYPASYGERNGVRLSGSAFTAYEGWLGHQHAPENSHGDPFGPGVVTDLFRRMGGGTTEPIQEDDLPTPEDVWAEPINPGPTADKVAGWPADQAISAGSHLTDARARIYRLEKVESERYNAVQEKLSALRDDVDSIQTGIDAILAKLGTEGSGGTA